MKYMHLLIGTLLCAAAAFAVDTPPVLMSPINGMELTDVATYFQWQPVAGCTNFEIQIAREVVVVQLAEQPHEVVCDKVSGACCAQDVDLISLEAHVQP